MANDKPDNASWALKAYLERRRLQRRITELAEADKNGWVNIPPVQYFGPSVELLNRARNSSHGLVVQANQVQIERSGIVYPRRRRGAQSRSVRIAKPPGTWLARCARFLLTKEAYRRYVYPVIADMQHEYIQALAAGEPLHARWIAVRGGLLVVPGWLVGLACRVVKGMFSA